MQIQPPATLLMGPSGSGKSSALTTYLEADVETFVLCTEPGGAESLIDFCEAKKYNINKLHWATAMPATGAWTALENLVTEISTKDFETISKNKAGISKEVFRAPAMKILKSIQNFVCERTGKDFGDVTTWGPDRHFALDSLSGLSLIAWNLTVGLKPTAHQGEWGIGMNFIEGIINKITSDRKCFLTVTSHVEKEMNEITGVNQIMVSTLGRKLAPKLPRFFSEVVYAKRNINGEKADFTWSTVDQSADLKNRGLSIGSKLQPSFVPLVKRYNERMKALGTPSQSPAQVPATNPATPVAK